jgi:hypothetical protein
VKDPTTHGSFFVLVIGGSDKTTVSVGTGHQECSKHFECGMPHSW